MTIINPQMAIIKVIITVMSILIENIMNVFIRF